MVVVALCCGDAVHQQGTGKLDSVLGKMNGAKCSEIQEKNCLGWSFAYQKDKDPKHTAKNTQATVQWNKNYCLTALEWTRSESD